MASIDIICPVYAEEKGILPFHARLSGVIDKMNGHNFRVLYVVDPAGDSTERVLESLAQRDTRVEVLVMSRRFGHQIALVAGMDASNADATVMLDSDMQHPPELIPEMVAQWEDGGEIVQAVRMDGQETAWWKRSTSRWFYSSFMQIGNVELRSGAADFRLLSRRVLDIFKSEVREHNPFLRGLVGWVGFNVRYITFKNAPRLSGGTKYNLVRLVDFAINGVCSFSKLPLRLCIVTGLVSAVASVFCGAVMVTLYIGAAQSVPGWASLFAAVTFLGGVQLIFLGVLGEYISLIFDEVKGRPRYLISRRFGSTSTVPELTLNARGKRQSGENAVERI